MLYCSEAFLTSLPVKKCDRLLAIHRRALRAAAGADFDADCDQLALRLHVIPILQRWLVKMCRFVYECHSQPASAVLGSLLHRLDSRYATRGMARHDVSIPLVSKKAGTSSLTYRLPLIWSSLPKNAKLSQSSSQLIGKLFRHCMIMIMCSVLSLLSLIMLVVQFDDIFVDWGLFVVVHR